MGAYGTESGQWAFSEQWNGTAWSFVSVPHPPGASDSTLAGVACPAVNNCFAVGDQNVGTTRSTFIARWNGGSWSIVASPVPAGATLSSLAGVSCASARDCTAVGRYSVGAPVLALAQRWNGTAWSITTVPAPAGATTVELHGVACRTASACFAVGRWNAGGPGKLLVERWNANHWSLVPAVVPSGETDLDFEAVACPTGQSCFAVGDFATATTKKTLVEHWNGAHWGILPTQNRAGDNTLLGVDCPTPKSCFASGSSAPSPAVHSLVEHWNGAHWTAMTTADPPSADARFDGVSCPTPKSCFAVGDHGGNEMTAHWNGASWGLQTAPAGSSESGLAQVSCVTDSACFAVGSAFYGTSQHTLVERWNGAAWSIVPSADPAGGGALAGVSCPAPTTCVAVGYSGFASTTRAIVEQWDGAHWQLGALATPAGVTTWGMRSVRCPSVTSCFAVGFAHTTKDTALVEHWDGAGWSILPVADPAGSTGTAFTDVACPTTTSCVASGDYDSAAGFVTLIEVWNGATWTIAPSPNAAGSSDDLLFGTTCVSPTSCLAVGEALVGSIAVPLTETWDGMNWTVVAAPAPAGASHSELDGVQCYLPTRCMAVGSAVVGSSVQVLALGWNGVSWSPFVLPHLAATDASEAGVACPSESTCYAVGGFSARASQYTLVERHGL